MFSSPSHIIVIHQRKMYAWLKQKEDKKKSIFQSVFPTYMNGLIYDIYCLHLKSAGRSTPKCFNLPPTLHYLRYSHGRDPISHYVSALTLHYHHQCQGEVNLRLEASYMQGCSPQWPVSSWGLHVKFNLLFTLNFYHFKRSYSLFMVCSIRYIRYLFYTRY